AAWVLHFHTQEAAVYAADRAHEREEDPDRRARLFAEWQRYLEREGIEAIRFGLITLRHSTTRAGWFCCDDWPEQQEPNGEALAQGFEARDCLEADRDDRALLGATLQTAPGLRLEQHSGLGPQGWAVVESRLRRPDGWSDAVKANLNVIEILAKCRSGRRL